MAFSKPISSVRHAKPLPKKPLGAGTAFATVAKPIAKAVGLEDCVPCVQRQVKWDKAVPDVFAVPKRIIKKVVGLFKK